MIGRILDRYQIEAKLGEGGMGVVYRARDTRLDRTVAIKVLPPEKVADPERTQRFVQEAKAASALNHPNIVTVHDIRSDAGVDFIVMEYAEGRTLDQVIPAKGLGVAQALRYGVQIADALAAAHAAGIVHRDVKPSNIMVTVEDRVKVLDFGIAKLFDHADRAAEAGTRTTPSTEAGIVLGTAAYMSPEQAQGRPVDTRSDIFSFGGLLYEMLTGRRTFAGDSSLAVLAKILNEDPAPPSTLSAAVSLDVERAILRCLRRDPARRFQTMADLKVALEDLLADSAAGLAVQPPAVSTPRRRRWIWAAAVPVVVVAAYAGWRAMPSPESVTPVRAVPLLSLPGVTRSPSFSPDGNQIAFGWRPAGGNQDIYVQQIGAGTPLQLTTNADNDYSPTWSPDGRWIAFLRGEGDGRRHELRLVPPLGGPERRLSEIQPRGFLRTATMAWCPDSSCVVVTDSPGAGRPDALFAVSLDSGERRQITRPQDSAFADSDPALSPDGKWLAFRREVAPFTGELTLLPLAKDLTAAGEPRRLTPYSLPAYNPRWTPDSSEVLFSAKAGLWRIRISGDGTPEQMPFVGEDGTTPDVSGARGDRPARLAYVRVYTDVNIWRVEVASPGASPTSPPVVAIASTRRDAIAHFAPDGRHVTFTSNRSGENEIWRADSSGADAVQLTFMAANPGWPRWSPSGDQIAFHSNPDGNGDIILVPAEGGKPRNLTSHPATDTFPTFSRDGRWVYFSSTRSGGPRIWKMPAAGGPAIQVTAGPGMMAIESEDGTFLYYTESTSTNRPATLWRVPVAGGAAVKITEGVNSTALDVTRNGIYYLGQVAGETRIQYFDFESRTTLTVARDLGNVDFGLAASPDGRTILFSRTDSSVNDLMLVDNFR